MPRRFGFGLGFNISRLSGLPEPSGFVAKYQAYDVDDFTLVTGSNASQWDDRTTQTFGSEEVTNGTFDTDSDWTKGAGWTISGGVVDYDGTGGTSFLQQTLNWTNGVTYQLVIDVDYNEGTGNNTVFFGDGNSVSSVNLEIGKTTITGVKGGSNNVLTITGRTGENLRINSISVKEILTGANHLTQGTSSNQPVLTQDTNRFNNTVDFGTDDFMTGLPTQSGDFTYVFKGVSLNIIGSTNNVLLTNGISNQSLFFVANFSTGNYAVRSNQQTIYEFSVPYSPTDSNIALIRELNTLTLYINGSSVDTLDVTGSTFDFPLLGRSSTSINGSLQELYVYDRALTQDEINWFSYLRDSNNNISPLPPILPS